MKKIRFQELSKYNLEGQHSTDCLRATASSESSMRLCSVVAGLLLMIALLSVVDTAHAQSLYGGLTGNVTDSSDAAIPGARVEAVNVSTGIVRQMLTDVRGSYLFSDLQPGRYRVTVTAPNFNTTVQEGVAIEINTMRRVDTSLSVAQVTEVVSVSAAAVALQTDRADVNNQLQGNQVTNIPLGGQRNYQSLLALIPGATMPFVNNSDSMNPQGSLRLTVNGIDGRKNGQRLDGAINDFPWLPWHAAYIPAAEAIETVGVVSNSFDAEQGMAGGAAIDVSIKSGTNEFHGSGWWYHTNSALRARNFFDKGDRLPKSILNQGGFAIGGPIVRNKVFFFTDWERTLQRKNAAGIVTIAPEALRQGNFAGTGAAIYDPLTGNANGSGRQLFPDNRIPSARLDPASVIMSGLLPSPNLSGFPNNYFASGNYETNRDNFDIKINYNPVQQASMYGRYSFSPHKNFDPQALGPAGGQGLNFPNEPGFGDGITHSAAIGGTYTVTPRLMIDGNFGATRQVLLSENVDIGSNFGLDTLKIPGTNGPNRHDGGIPTFGISGFHPLGNASNASPFDFLDSQFGYHANVGWMTGSHNLRIGWQSRRTLLRHTQLQTLGAGRGGFNFTGGLTALRGGAAPTLNNSWADFLLGLPQNTGRGLQTVAPAVLRQWSHGFYVRDHWQATRKLTLTLGVRLERFPFVTRDGQHGVERYDPAIDRVLIGGVGNVPLNTGVDDAFGHWGPRLGIAYRLNDKTVVRAGYGINSDAESLKFLITNYPTIIFLSFSGNSSFESAGTLRTGLPSVPAPDLGNGIIPLPNAVSTVTVPEKLDRGYMQSANFTLQRDLGAGFVAEAAYVGTRALKQLANLGLNVAGPGGGNAGRALAPRTGNINVLFGNRRSYYDSLQTKLTRRLATDVQLGVTYTYSKAIDELGGVNWLPAWNRNKGLAGFDLTHNFQSWAIANLPFGPGKRWAQSGVSSAVLRDWQLNVMLSRTSGSPFGVSTSAASLNAPGNSQTADQVLSEVKILGGHGPGQSYFDPNAFAPVTAVRFGTSGRNILRGPGLFQADLGLDRTFTVTESVRLQFRAEAFNFTNTPAFGNPGSNVSSATRNPDGTIRALNGYTEIASARDNSRQFRLSLTLRF